MSNRALKTEFLKECMGDALLRLMQEKPLEKITIAEITSLAGVGRSMYFRNFGSRQELLLFKYRMLWKRWCQTHPLDTSRKYSIKNTRICLQFFYSIRVLNTTIYAAGQQHILYELVQEICHMAGVETYLQPEPASTAAVIPKQPLPSALYTDAFYSHALWGILNTWILRDYREPVEQILQTIYHTVP